MMAKIVEAVFIHGERYVDEGAEDTLVITNGGENAVELIRVIRNALGLGIQEALDVRRSLFAQGKPVKLPVKREVAEELLQEIRACGATAGRIRESDCVYRSRTSVMPLSASLEKKLTRAIACREAEETYTFPVYRLLVKDIPPKDAEEITEMTGEEARPWKVGPRYTIWGEIVSDELADKVKQLLGKTYPDRKLLETDDSYEVTVRWT